MAGAAKFKASRAQPVLILAVQEAAFQRFANFKPYISQKISPKCHLESMAYVEILRLLLLYVDDPILI